MCGPYQAFTSENNTHSLAYLQNSTKFYQWQTWIVINWWYTMLFRIHLYTVFHIPHCQRHPTLKSNMIGDISFQMYSQHIPIVITNACYFVKFNSSTSWWLATQSALNPGLFAWPLAAFLSGESSANRGSTSQTGTATRYKAVPPR